MLRREEELRLSKETQSAFYKVRFENNGIFDVVEKLQGQVAREFGMSEDEGKHLLRCADLYIGMERAKELSLYRRNNICVDGNLKVGEIAPLIEVPPLLVVGGEYGKRIRLSALPKPLVLLGGSMT